MEKLLLTILFLSISRFGFSQKSVDEIKEEIKVMEKRETTAFIAVNLEEINKIWAKDIVVNSPLNRINQSAALLTKLLKDGIIQHKAISRNIEEIFVYENIAISMGNELVTNMDNTIITRRYTNTWANIKGEWKLKYRHANIICK